MVTLPYYQGIAWGAKSIEQYMMKLCEVDIVSMKYVMRESKDIDDPTKRQYRKVMYRIEYDEII